MQNRPITLLIDDVMKKSRHFPLILLVYFLLWCDTLINDCEAALWLLQIQDLCLFAGTFDLVELKAKIM